MNKRPPQWADQPQEIPDAEHERLVARVCAIDLNKAASSLKVCEQLVQLGWKVEAGKPQSEAGDRTIGLDDVTNNVVGAENAIRAGQAA